MHYINVCVYTHMYIYKLKMYKVNFIYLCHYEVKIRRTKVYGDVSPFLLKAARAIHKMTKLPAHL